jgi:hypothetical protein
MTRLSVLAIATLTFIASPTFFLAASTPASAQNDDWGTDEPDIRGGSLRELLRDWMEERTDRRDMLMDLIQERQDQRGELMDLLHERMNRGGEIREFLRNHPELRERVASRWNNDGDDGGALRDRIRERLSERLDGSCFFLTRSLRKQDGSLLVVVRRRVCRD